MQNALRALALACIAGLLPLLAHAQTFTPPPCAPKTLLSPWGSGTPWVRGLVQHAGTGPRVSFRAWWCPNADGTWSRYIHLSVERLELTREQIELEIDRASAATSPLAAIQQAVTRFQVAPVGAEVAAWNDAVDAAVAALAPTKPGVIVEQWIVTGSLAFPLKADGTRAITAWPVPPIKGEACDCATKKISQYGATFCAVPRLSSQQVIVAGCGVRK